MRARAPGKLVVAGAYVVLDGADALVLAVDRYAEADARVRDPSPSREVRAAFGDRPAPRVDVRAFYTEGRKLGLGSSAAQLVAALGAEAVAKGPLDDEARREILVAATAAHQAAQGGGSGIDVAASVYGGALSFNVGRAPQQLPLHAFPFSVFFSGQSARTSDFLARVRGFRGRDAAGYARHASAITSASEQVLADFAAAKSLVPAVRAYGRALSAFGQGADIPIVPEAFATLSRAADAEDGAFVVAGAGGGDVGIFYGTPSAAFGQEAARLGFSPLNLAPAKAGVELVES
jgi:phosphomevalonate kinase